MKQTGGKGQYAHVVLRIEPNEGKGYEFVDRIKVELFLQNLFPRSIKVFVKRLKKVY